MEVLGGFKNPRAGRNQRSAPVILFDLRRFSLTHPAFFFSNLSAPHHIKLTVSINQFRPSFRFAPFPHCGPLDLVCQRSSFGNFTPEIHPSPAALSSRGLGICLPEAACHKHKEKRTKDQSSILVPGKLQLAAACSLQKIRVDPGFSVAKETQKRDRSRIGDRKRTYFRYFIS